MKRTIALFAAFVCIIATNGMTSEASAQACNYNWTSTNPDDIPYRIETNFGAIVPPWPPIGVTYTATANSSGSDLRPCGCWPFFGCEVVIGVWIHVGVPEFVAVGTTEVVSNGLITATVTVTATGMTVAP